MANKIYKILTLLMMCLLFSGLFITSCEKDKENNGNVVLRSYGPSPALRGGQLRFIGRNLDQVTAVVLPDNIEITTFLTKTPTLLVVEVPQEAVDGTVTIRTPHGDIAPQTLFAISEPISIDTILPAIVRPGDSVTIMGDYLNLIEEVIFFENKSVTSESFVNQNRFSFKVKVPENAKTGVVTISNGDSIPILVESSSPLEIVLPAFSSNGAITPNPVKAGTSLTITGTNLDLVDIVEFGGEIRVSNFTTQTQTQIEVNVPAGARDDKIKLIPASFYEVLSADSLKMMVPTISSVSPNPARTGGTITVTGSNLDLITRVTFGGGRNANPSPGGTETQITVPVPVSATDGNLIFTTAANKTVRSTDLITMVVPAITSVSPLTAAARDNITITGTNLNVVDSIRFGGGWKAKVTGATPTQIVVGVTPGSVTGAITLVTTNGTTVTSADVITITPNVPVITNITSVGVGELLNITGTNMDVTTAIIFPGNVTATLFGVKTSTLLQVVVPANATKGHGTIRFITIDNEVLEEDIYITEDISYYIYNDALTANWQQWGGWGVTSQDWANTEQPKSGSRAIKVVFPAGYGAIQAHPTVPDILTGYNYVKFSVYGGTGSSGARVQLYIKDNSDVEHTKVPVNIVPGVYTTFTISMSELGNPPSVKEFCIQNMNTAMTIYIDDIGTL